MILRETAMKIKLLAQEGVPKTRIAERLGVSRQTVYNHLNRVSPRRARCFGFRDRPTSVPQVESNSDGLDRAARRVGEDSLLSVAEQRLHFARGAGSARNADGQGEDATMGCRRVKRPARVTRLLGEQGKVDPVGKRYRAELAEVEAPEQAAV